MRILGNKQGFTLVELSLSIAFIAILSITVALIINDAISTYRRGLTLNQINTTGMDLVDDIRATVQNSSPRAVVEKCTAKYGDLAERNKCIDNKAQRFVVVRRLAKVDTDKDGTLNNNVPVFGAFCTGAYSYVWNSGYFYAGDDVMMESGIDEAEIRYKDKSGADVTEKDFRLIKIQDKERAVCASTVRSVYNKDVVIGNVFDIRSDYEKVLEEPEILLAAGDDTVNSLALYDLTVATPATNGANNSMFYSMSFILGTIQGGINVMSSGNFCAAPGEYDSNFDYCAINKFNFAAQANGG